MSKEIAPLEMIDLLTGHFPNQKIGFDLNHFKITRLTVEVIYPFEGKKQDMLKTILNITEEWDFMQVDYKYSEGTGKLKINYSIKPFDVEKFVRKVLYRGEVIRS